MQKRQTPEIQISHLPKRFKSASPKEAPSQSTLKDLMLSDFSGEDTICIKRKRYIGSRKFCD